jgi:hypothetical protein
MSTTTPILARFAVVQVGGTAIGYLTDFSMDTKADLIKEYVCQSGGSAASAFLASGNQSYTFKASALFVPSAYSNLLNDVLNGTAVTIIYGPQGSTTGSGTPKITFNNAVLTAYSVKNGQKGTIANDISGEAQTITVGTF